MWCSGPSHNGSRGGARSVCTHWKAPPFHGAHPKQTCPSIVLSQTFESEFGVIRRDVFHVVAELEVAIDEWIAHRNQQQKPFTWTAKAKPILASRCRPSSKQDASQSRTQLNNYRLAPVGSCF